MEYRDNVAQIEKNGVLNALLTLNASYRKDYYSDQRKAMERRQIEYKIRAMSWLRGY